MGRAWRPPAAPALPACRTSRARLMGLKSGIACRLGPTEKLEFRQGRTAAETRPELRHPRSQGRLAPQASPAARAADIIFDPVGGKLRQKPRLRSNRLGRAASWVIRICRRRHSEDAAQFSRLLKRPAIKIRGVFWGAWARLNPEKRNRAKPGKRLVKWTAEGKNSRRMSNRTFPLWGGRKPPTP